VAVVHEGRLNTPPKLKELVVFLYTVLSELIIPPTVLDAVKLIPLADDKGLIISPI